MEKVDLRNNITYRHSSLRFFDDGEHHCTRYSKDNVLIMVYEGVLRITENGVDYEIGAGQYHIQRQGGFVEGKYPSCSPKYLYVHFFCEWNDTDEGIPHVGTFDVEKAFPLMERLDKLKYGEAPYIIRAAGFYEILSLLYNKKKTKTVADDIAEFLEKGYKSQITLSTLTNKFNFSKNHIINIFKKEYRCTPFEYINKVRIKYAEGLLESTSDSSESIAAECGFNNYSHFYRLFKEINGISPSEWRKKKRIYPY